MARIASRGRPMPSLPGGGALSSRSSPAQKARPAPVSTVTHASLSRATASIAAESDSTSANDIAFNRAGLSSVMSATWGRGVETWTSDDIAAVYQRRANLSLDVERDHRREVVEHVLGHADRDLAARVL